MDNPKVIVKETGIMGRGLFTIEDIAKNEIIADWTGGPVYHAKRASKLPNDLPLRIRDHAIQFMEDRYVDTYGIARFANHSCEPNCGIRGRFKLVSMRSIKEGEELTFDYEMTEDSDWRMICECKADSCRKIIGAFKNMPVSVRDKYKGYISEWLIDKYKL